MPQSRSAQSGPPGPGTSSHDGGDVPSAIVPRDLSGAVLGDFQVERKLGRGGMGEVYLARQISLNRPVALKVIRFDHLSNETTLARFKAEARAAAKLSHPNIVHIYTYDLAGTIRFIAMEYVPGTNLREYLARKGALELPAALSIMRQAAAAVGAAGEMGLVHRDIKPENLLLTKKGQVKVADFGLCRDLAEGQRMDLTRPGTALGTPQYMSPEQCQGKPLDHRTDLYSLGVTYYHILAGQPPFRADNALAMALKHIHEPPPDLLALRPDLPPELVAVVNKLLAKEPADRYQTAQDLIRDLARFRVDAATGVAMTIPGPTGPTTAAGTKSSPSLAIPEALPASTEDQATGAGVLGRRLAIAAGLLACVTAGALAAYLARSPDLLGDATPSPTAPPGLWLDPRWEDVPAQKSVEAQYRYAQLEAPPEGRVAAWLAVPGRFPDPWLVVDGRLSDDHPSQHHWGLHAYAQLARDLFRARDAERLDALAAELGRSDRPDDRRLATTTRAAALTLRDDLDDALELLRDPAPPTPGPPSPTELALAELALEVADELDDRGRRDRDFHGEHAPAVKELQNRLASRLRLDPPPRAAADPKSKG